MGENGMDWEKERSLDDDMEENPDPSETGLKVFRITEDMKDIRIDKCLLLLLDSFSRSYIQKLIRNGCVHVGERPVKANYKVKTEDVVEVLIPDPVESDVLPEDIPLDILYEDSDLLVVNKPKGMVVHPAAGHDSGTLVNGLLYYCKGGLSGIGGVTRPGIVHRIDRDTTGSLLVCKNDFAHDCIARQLKEHSVTRYYAAIVHGVIKEETGTVCAPIGRHPQDRKRMAVNYQNGRDAVTHFRVLARFREYTYIECRLETGRTHQIRVHMASLGHPLLGDMVYAPGRKSGFSLEGQTLHARVLGFVHPRTGRYIETEAPLPEYFKHLLNVLSSRS